jgi:Arc/MetJ family transcription regulator
MLHQDWHEMMYHSVLLRLPDTAMRTTLNIDHELLGKAQRITGLTEKSALVREGLRALIERESARRLARLGGSEPQLEPVPRRQTRPE